MSSAIKFRVTLMSAAVVGVWSGIPRAEEAQTPAQKHLAEVQRQVQAAQEQLTAAQARFEAMERKLAEAERGVITELVDRARAGDEAALRQVLDSLGDANFVEYHWAGAVSGPGPDADKIVRLIRERLPDADPLLRSKLCWLLGRNGSAQAAAALRGVLATDTDADVLGNAVFALSRCPDSPENLAAVKRHTDDARKLVASFGFYARRDLGLLARRYVERRDTSRFAAVPGEVVVEEPTLFCAGFQWRLLGESDSNHNCAVSVAYRKAGTAGWKQGFSFLRCVSWDSGDPKYPFDVGNLLAGSIFDLEPGTAYEVKLTLSDPDGVTADRTVNVVTRTEPPVYEGLRTLHVVPADGGPDLGTGTKKDPFKGLTAADNAAQPGDVMLLQPGTYSGSVALTKSGKPGKPIVWRGADRDAVVFDGTGKDESLAFSGQDHLQFEDITFKGANQGCIKTFGCQHIVVRRCVFKEFRYGGIIAQGRAEKVRDGQVLAEARNCKNWFVTDNEVLGPASWEKGRKRSSYGVNLSGAGHVIAYNRIENCWDAISLAGGRGAPNTGSLDVCYNDLRNATDDGIEADYVYHNTRLFRNRLTNTFSSMSFQPVFGGPGYMLYNAMHNTTNKPFKLHVNPTGMIIAHNTCTASREAFYGGNFHEAHIMNNLLLGLRGEQGYWLSTQGHPLDLDYTGYNVATPTALVKCNNVRYQTMAAFAEDTGRMKHAVLVDWDVFAAPAVPPGPGLDAPPNALQLRPGSPAVDAGLVLPGINDGYTGAAPDLGCYEVGRPVPHYGPR